MSPSQMVSAADVADRHRQYFALALLGVGLIYLAKAVAHLVSGGVAEFLDHASTVLALLVIGSLVPAMITKLRLPADQKMIYFSEDGYVAQLLRRAFSVSWVTTLISLISLEFIARGILADLPSVFFIQVGLFILLSVMSVTFLLLNWSANSDLKRVEV